MQYGVIMLTHLVSRHSSDLIGREIVFCHRRDAARRSLPVSAVFVFRNRSIPFAPAAIERIRRCKRKWGFPYLPGDLREADVGVEREHLKKLFSAGASPFVVLSVVRHGRNHVFFVISIARRRCRIRQRSERRQRLRFAIICISSFGSICMFVKAFSFLRRRILRYGNGLDLIYFIHSRLLHPSALFVPEARSARLSAELRHRADASDTLREKYVPLRAACRADSATPPQNSG